MDAHHRRLPASVASLVRAELAGSRSRARAASRRAGAGVRLPVRIRPRRSRHSSRRRRLRGRLHRPAWPRVTRCRPVLAASRRRPLPSQSRQSAGRRGRRACDLPDGPSARLRAPGVSYSPTTGTRHDPARRGPAARGAVASPLADDRPKLPHVFRRRGSRPDLRARHDPRARPRAGAERLRRCRLRHHCCRLVRLSSPMRAPRCCRHETSPATPLASARSPRPSSACGSSSPWRARWLLRSARSSRALRRQPGRLRPLCAGATCYCAEPPLDHAWACGAPV